MVDVAAKAATHRIAIAQGRIVMNPATLSIILEGSAKKGFALPVLPSSPSSETVWKKAKN